jgi:asparagine synthase (glutamine-hydrolysing)
MCGISGLISKRNIPESRFNDFIKSSDLMNHRGPDYKGVFRENEVLLVHYRLSIIDLDKRSNQPFFSKNKNLVTVYNGEIYNYKELAKKHSITQTTTSDTEILTEMFDKGGKEIVNEWNGIFACAIYDRAKMKIHFMRDRLGVKPLYIYEDESVIAFSSEAKVIMDWLPNFKLNKDALAQFIWFGNTTGLKTHAQDLNKQAPGTITTINFNKSFKEKEQFTFWSLKEVEEISISEPEAIQKTEYLLEQSVKRQLVADVPVGVLLSGGIDSSSIVAFASKYYSGKLDTYSVEFDYNIGGKSELEKAAKVAKRYNTNHHELLVDTKDVVTTFKELVIQYDEPFADAASIPLYQLSLACSKDKRVILQGDGGDELFAGYRRYNVMQSYWFWKLSSKAYPFIPSNRWKERMKRIDFVLNKNEGADMLAYYLTEEVPYKHPFNIFTHDFRESLNNVNWKEDYQNFHSKYKNLDRVQNLLYADVEIILPNRFLEKVDKATMLASMEARVPFLDNDLAQFAFSLPSSLKVRKGSKKYLLKKAMENHVPHEILYGPKRGFDVPIREWLRTDLYNFAREVFSSLNFDILNKEVLLQLLEDHKNRKADYSSTLWKSLVLGHWLEHYKDKIIF